MPKTLSPFANTVTNLGKNDTGYLCLMLPFPPSVNSIIRCIKSRRIKTPLHTDYMEEAVRVIRKQPHRLISGLVSLSLALGRPDKRKRDLDNHAKAVLDALVVSCVLADDSQVQRLEMWWDTDVVGARVEITEIQ